jgi:hypothetical protein
MTRKGGEAWWQDRCTLAFLLALSSILGAEVPVVPYVAQAAGFP